jgi:PIN domain nuclease of toxin-antitoxin system
MIEDRHFLSKDVLYLLEDYSNQFYISSESVKEMIHLFQTRKVIVKKWKTAQDIIFAIEDDWNIGIKYIKREHLVTLAGLDRVENHNDPSDRLIIAQAITENIPLISSDRKFEHYRKQQLQFIYNKK